MRCDQLQPSWKPSFLCCSECSRKIGEYAPDLISCSRVRSEHVLGCSFLCSVTRNVQSKTAQLSNEARRQHAFMGTYNLSAASNPRVLVENYRPKQAPNLPFGQNLQLVSILT